LLAALLHVMLQIQPILMARLRTAMLELRYQEAQKD